MKRLLLILMILLSSGPALAAQVLNVQKFITPKGIEVWLNEDRSIPVIAMNFSFEGGLLYDPPDKPGVGRLVSILLDEGADDMDGQAFQLQLSDLAIDMNFTAGRDAFYGEVKTLEKNRARAFDLLRKALTAPRFEEGAIARMKAANVNRIRQDLGSPSWLVARVFNGTVFEGHSYAAPGFGTLSAMENITRKDLQSFVSTQFNRAGLKVAIAGALSREEAIHIVDTVFSTLPERKIAPLAKEAALSAIGKTVLFPLDAPQTYFLAGVEGIPRLDKDWAAAVVLNEILGGGGFDSRLMRELREKRGLTYGAYTSLNAMRYAALFQVNFSSSNETAAEALTVLREEWARFYTSGPTGDEVENAKSYLTGSLALELTSTGAVAGTLNNLQRDGLNYDYINRRNADISAVTAADVRRVAKRLLKPENMTIVMVGKPKNIIADVLLDAPPGMNTAERRP